MKREHEVKEASKYLMKSQCPAVVVVLPEVRDYLDQDREDQSVNLHWNKLYMKVVVFLNDTLTVLLTVI